MGAAAGLWLWWTHVAAAAQGWSAAVWCEAPQSARPRPPVGMHMPKQPRVRRSGGRGACRDGGGADTQARLL